ncbi:MAG: endonuclease V [Myxococcales bacterium]|nr:endonuclease V [Myxococcales bacterium]
MKAPLIAVDVAYEEGVAFVAAVVFDDWRDAEARVERVLAIPEPAPYVPGEFYRRELPCILRILDELAISPRAVVVDGFVWLDDGEAPGLGAHLWRALDERVAVVGVAKSPFRTTPPSAALRRGHSDKLLYVTAAGIDLEDAKQHIRQMHGEHRLPTLLRRVDQLARRVVTPEVR